LSLRVRIGTAEAVPFHNIYETSSNWARPQLPTRGQLIHESFRAFTLEELCFSEAAERLGLDNTPSAAIIANLGRVAEVMEAIRARLGDKAIVVHSGYRSVEVNRAVGGVGASAHCLGLACDFASPAFGTPVEVALAIVRSGIEYDQLILEYGWVHVGVASPGMLSRREVLTKRSPQAAYEWGIRAGS